MLNFQTFHLQKSKNGIFVEPACCERNIAVTFFVWYMCICHACMCQSRFVRAITSALIHGFQNNMAQLLSLRRRTAIGIIFSGRLKVKVALVGQMIKWS